MFARDLDRARQRAGVAAESRAIANVDGLTESTIIKEIRRRRVDDIFAAAHEGDVRVKIVCFSVAIFVLVDVETAGTGNVRGRSSRCRSSRGCSYIPTIILNRGQE